MSATVKFSTKPCFICKEEGMTFKAKFKDGRFDGILCAKHLYENLEDCKSDEIESKAEKKP